MDKKKKIGGITDYCYHQKLVNSFAYGHLNSPIYQGYKAFYLCLQIEGGKTPTGNIFCFNVESSNSVDEQLICKYIVCVNSALSLLVQTTTHL